MDKYENYRICHSEKSKVLVDGVAVVVGVHDDLGDVHPHLVVRMEIDQQTCQKILKVLMIGQMEIDQHACQKIVKVLN